MTAATYVEWWKPGWRERLRQERAAQPAPVLPAEPAKPRRVYFGGSMRRRGGVSRFGGTSHHADQAAASLPADHDAILERRTLFPTRVFDVVDVPRVLISGHNSAKLGDMVRKGAWRGMPLFSLTLEERATCPDTCPLWRECYGSAMPLARRVRPGPELVAALDRELRAKAAQHRQGFVVRLHVLGDFYSAEYVLAWLRWMNAIPALHVFGYTAHASTSDIGTVLARANARWPDRFAIRSSVAADAPLAPMQATTIWRQPEGRQVPEGTICPAQNGGTEACATCGLCWALPAQGKRIVFVGHGMNRLKGGRRKVADA